MEPKNSSIKNSIADNLNHYYNKTIKTANIENFLQNQLKIFKIIEKDFSLYLENSTSKLYITFLSFFFVPLKSLLLLKNIKDNQKIDNLFGIFTILYYTLKNIPFISEKFAEYMLEDIELSLNQINILKKSEKKVILISEIW